MNTYQNNLKSIEKASPRLHKKLQSIQTNKRFEVFAPDQLEYAQIFDTFTKQFLYPENVQNFLREKELQLQKYRLYRTLYFYGIGNGTIYAWLLQNLNIKTLYIVEPNLELMYIALNLHDFSKAIKEKKLVLLHSVDATKDTFYTLFDGTDNTYFKAYDLLIHSPYYENFSDDIIRVNHEIIVVFSYLIKSSGNDIIDELIGMKHFLNNIPHMVRNPTLKELANKKNSPVAIIVATGPSLSKQLPLLKKIQNKATLFSVDASLPILEKNDIFPDIAVSIERVEATAKFYESCSEAFKKHIIFSVSSVVHPRLVNAIMHGTMQFHVRPKKYYEFFGLSDWGYIGNGMSAANLAYELAAFMGYEKIVLIGQDLAYAPDGTSHADNHIYGIDEVKQSQSKGIYLQAYGGKGKVLSNPTWKLFLEGYIKEIATNNQIGKIKTINATEGGARIPGTIELSFSEVIETYIVNLPDKARMKLERPSSKRSKKMIKNAKEKLNEAIQLGESMLVKVKKLKHELEQYITAIESGEKHETKSSQTLIQKIMATRQYYYNSNFASFYEDLLSPLLTHLEFDIAAASIQPDNTEEEKNSKNIQMIILHVKWCTHLLVIEKILELLKGHKFQPL